jgi:ATP-dependent Clp protease ATP-binding subunit ClpC
LPHLLPSQLLLPPKVINNRYLRNELLYRVYSGKEQPPLRPTLIILDVSPPCFGPVEKLTRHAAYTLANTLYKAQKPVMLLAAGGQNSIQLIEKPADLLEVWTTRTLQPVQLGITLQTARALATTLQEDDLKPLVILLTHTYFGIAEENAAVEIPHLRGLFVRHPNTNERPAWAKQCERWEVMDDSALDKLPGVLIHLLE